MDIQGQGSSRPRCTDMLPPQTAMRPTIPVAAAALHPRAWAALCRLRLMVSDKLSQHACSLEDGSSKSLAQWYTCAKTAAVTCAIVPERDARAVNYWKEGTHLKVHHSSADVQIVHQTRNGFRCGVLDTARCLELADPASLRYENGRILRFPDPILCPKELPLANEQSGRSAVLRMGQRRSTAQLAGLRLRKFDGNCHLSFRQGTDIMRLRQTSASLLNYCTLFQRGVDLNLLCSE